MKHIVALWNSANKGKTQTLHHLADLLIGLPGSEVISSNLTASLTLDFRLIIRVNEIVVAIESQGDSGSGVLRRLKEIERQHHPEIIFCATRTRGETVRDVDSFARNFGYTTLWTSTYQLGDRSRERRANEAKARHLWDLISNELNLI